MAALSPSLGGLFLSPFLSYYVFLGLSQTSVLCIFANLKAVLLKKENRTTIPAKTEVGLLGLSLLGSLHTTVMTKPLATVLLTVARGFVHICMVVIVFVEALYPPTTSTTSMCDGKDL